MECPYCHAQNRENVRFCSFCGRKVLPDQTPVALPPTPVAPTGSGTRSSASSLTEGTPLQGGRYIIKKVLGQGGMGAALLATDKRLDNKLVVIKELISDSTDPLKLKENEENFKREVVTLAHLDHTLVPNVTDNFDENGRFFMVQEYVEGENLEEYLERVQRAMSEREVLTHASELLDVLDYLAQQTPPIVHRDIKPANIILGAKDKKAHLVDFGIARADVARNARRKQTSALGTPGYAPPEQYQGNADPRSDLYALGATLHHLITNRDPRNYQPFNYPLVRMFNAQLSPELERLLIRAVHNDRDQRYQSAAAMKREVDALLQGHAALGGSLSAGALAGPGVTGRPPMPVGATQPPPQVRPTTPPTALSFPQPGQPGARRKHVGRNVALVLLAMLLVSGLVYGALMLSRSGARNIPIVNGIGATALADGEYIGVSSGDVAFDTNRPDGSLKQQAAQSLQAGNATQAQGLWRQALQLESNDAEALIYLEDQKVLASGTFHVTIVVATLLSGANVGVGRDDLQGAYIAQKTFNDGSLLGGIGVVLLIANGSSDNTNAPAVSRQIVQAAQADPSIVGVMGWPFSSFVSQSVNIFKAAKIPVVSPTASSDLLSGISPYFFRVCPTNKIQGVAGAKYVAQNLHAKSVIVFADPLDPYSSSLASDFTAQYQADGNRVLVTEHYVVGKPDTIVTALQDALTHTNPVPGAFYFSGYANDISTLLTNLPSSGHFANLQVMGGDALYELGGYKPGANTGWNRLRFTSFTSPDVWDVLGFSAWKPAFFANYQHAYDPTHAHTSATYGWDRADSDAMLSYDATFTLLTAVKNTGKSQPTSDDEFQALTQITGKHALQGISGQIAFASNGDPLNKVVVILNVSQAGQIQMDKTIEGQFLL